MQQGAVFVGRAVVQIELPDANDSVLPGLKWGLIDAFPSPAYWTYQVLAKRAAGTTIRNRIGRTLVEEVVACLLGGHGMPAGVGLAAFDHLRTSGVFEETPCQAQLHRLLEQPLQVAGRAVHYRFARQRSIYLARAFELLATNATPPEEGRALRNWLLQLPGVGLKTASWIARNWLDADDVAILDIHVLRAGLLAGVFTPGRTVERNYLELEEQFLAFSNAIGVRPSELDGVIWAEMQGSAQTVRRLLDTLSPQQQTACKVQSRAHVGSAHAHQARLID